MFKKAAQRGRSEREAEAYSFPYVEALSDARTKLEAFFNILLVQLQKPIQTVILAPPTTAEGGAIKMAVTTVEQVEARLSGVRCAICKTNGFMIDRRSMQPDGEWKGVCTKCRYTFPVHTDMEFYQRTQPDIPYLLKGIPCPACQGRGVDLDFRIVMSVREAHYFVTCKTCGHQFPERSTLETFE